MHITETKSLNTTRKSVSETNAHASSEIVGVNANAEALAKATPVSVETVRTQSEDVNGENPTTKSDKKSLDNEMTKTSQTIIKLFLITP